MNISYKFFSAFITISWRRPQH